MKITIIPKIRSRFLDPTTLDLSEGQDLINYELPREFIDQIRKADPKDFTASSNVYLVISAAESTN